MAEATLHIGVGRENVTPPLGTQLMGYPDPFGKRTADSVRDPLNATALAIRTRDCEAIIVSLDVCIVDDTHVAAIRDGISGKTGVPPDHITVASIQSHSAPRTVAVWGWCEIDTPYVNEIMIPGAIAAGCRAFSAAVPARIGIGVGISDVGINRRALNREHRAQLGQYPIGLHDPEMTVLRCESAGGPLATLIHYGAHPTVLGSGSRVISRDWPGIMIDRVEGLTGAPVLYLNGAVGDVAPRTGSGGAVGDSETALWEAGAAAALAAMSAWRAIKDLRDLPLICESGQYLLPYKPLPAKAEAEAALAAATPNRDQPGAPMCEYQHWRAVVAAHGQAPRPGKAFNQCVTAVGPVALVPMPGEPFAEIVLRLRQASPFQHTLSVSTCNGANGYFCTQESLARGGYEPWVGRAMGAYLLADNIDDVLVDGNLSLLRAAHCRAYPPLTTG